LGERGRGAELLQAADAVVVEVDVDVEVEVEVEVVAAVVVTAAPLGSPEQCPEQEAEGDRSTTKAADLEEEVKEQPIVAGGHIIEGVISGFARACAVRLGSKAHGTGGPDAVEEAILILALTGPVPTTVGAGEKEASVFVGRSIGEPCLAGVTMRQEEGGAERSGGLAETALVGCNA